MGSDEEDIEFLRLAALKSRKQRNQQNKTQEKNNPNDFISNGLRTPGMRKNYKNRSHLSRGFRGSIMHNRGLRNGVPCRNSRVNSNLISIPIVNDENCQPSCGNSARRLQQSCFNPSQSQYSKRDDDTLTVSSKFSRYEHSDTDSESGSEMELSTSKQESVKRVDRRDSLDRLMDELENEIAGANILKPNVSDVDKLVVNKEIKSCNEVSKETKVNHDSKVIEFDVIIKEEPKSREPSPILIDNDKEDELQPNIVVAVQQGKTSPINVSNDVRSKSQSPNMKNQSRLRSPTKNRERSRSPIDKFKRNHSKSPFKFRSNRKASRSPPRDLPFYNTFFEDNPISPRCRPLSPLPVLSPLLPLGIDTEVLNTITMAPLSPRSAAFVLQNREILAKRKLSPRRSTSRSSDFSVSRSPTPKRRSISRERQNMMRNRSLSPRRSTVSPFNRSYPSPRRSQRRSMSPRNRNVSPRRRSRSSSRCRFYSPKRRSPEHSGTMYKKSRYSPPSKRRSRSPIKKSIHSRLGARPNGPKTFDDVRTADRTRRKSHSDRSLSLSLSPSPEHVNRNKEQLPTTDSCHVKQICDPVLEARKRKFESNKLVEPAGGVIKLKLKSENNESEKNQLEQDITSAKSAGHSRDESDSEFIDMNPTIDDLWSSDESESENEGRFKASKSTNNIEHSSNDLEKLNSSSKSSKKEVRRTSFRSSRRITSSERPRKYKSYKNRSRSPFRNRNQTAKAESNIYKKDKNDKKDVKITSENKNRTTSLKSYVNDRLDIVEASNSVVEEEKEKTKNNFDSRNSTEPKTKVSVQSAEKSDIQDKSKENKADIQTSSKTNTFKDENLTLAKITSRKVTGVSEKVTDSIEPEIIYEDEENKNDDEGDLRAELSRRRAQRRAISVVSVTAPLGPPTRILQNAFQEMSKKRAMPLPNFARPSKVIKREVKLPVRLRLGLPEEDIPLSNEEDFLNSYCKEINSELNEDAIVNVTSTDRKRNRIRGNRKKRVNVQV